MLVREDISGEILEYLRRNPEASDTLEGITEWWLLSHRISFEIKRVKAALAKLVRQGWVKRIKCKNSHIRYRLSPEKPIKKCHREKIVN